MYTHGSRGNSFRSHLIGGEPIANNRAQILTGRKAATENFLEIPNNTFCSTWESNPRPLDVCSRAYDQNRLPRQFCGTIVLL